jgi:hypothetical protein
VADGATEPSTAVDEESGESPTPSSLSATNPFANPITAHQRRFDKHGFEESVGVFM